MTLAEFRHVTQDMPGELILALPSDHASFRAPVRSVEVTGVVPDCDQGLYAEPTPESLSAAGFVLLSVLEFKAGHFPENQAARPGSDVPMDALPDTVDGLKTIAADEVYLYDWGTKKIRYYKATETPGIIKFDSDEPLQERANERKGERIQWALYWPAREAKDWEVIESVDASSVRDVAFGYEDGRVEKFIV